MEEYEIGDLVVSYIMNSSMPEPEILHHGVIIDINESLEDILVVDNSGSSRWWNIKRWKILSKKK